MYWKISPHQDANHDYCVMPAATEAQHRAALEYAIARLEENWDAMQAGDEFAVAIQLCDGEMPEVWD